MPARRIDEFDVYEFHVVVAEDKGMYTAVGRDSSKQEVARSVSKDLSEAKQQIRHRLCQLSDDFVGYPGAINQFLRAFPGGFEDPFFLFDERGYKIKAHEKAKKYLSKDSLKMQIDGGLFIGVAEAARKVFTNLIFPNEGMAFKSLVSTDKNAKVFAPLLYELLHGDSFDESFDKMVHFLNAGGAAKWTIMSYWPFVLYPTSHMFMKPEVAQEAARRLGDSFGYESKPNSIIYRKYLGFVTRLKEEIGALNPCDNIDLQTFMYAVGKSGFVRDCEGRRELWMQSRQISDISKPGL